MSDIATLTKRELLSILFKEKRTIIIVFCGLFLSAIGVSYLTTPVYEAEARLLIKSGRELQIRAEPGQASPIVPTTTMQEIVNSEVQILTSRDLLGQVIERIGLERLYPDAAKAARPGSDPMDGAVRRFALDLKAKPSAMSSIVVLSYLNQDRKVAIEALNTLLALYQEKHASLFNEPRSGFLEQQTRDYEAQLASAIEKVSEFKQSLSLSALAEQRTQLILTRSALATTLHNLQSQVVDAQRRLAYLDRKLKTVPALVPSVSEESEYVEAAKTRLVDLQAQLQGLRQRYSADVKPIRDVEEQIALVESSLQGMVKGKNIGNRKTASERNPAYDDLTISKHHAEADAAALNEQISLRRANLAEIDARLRALEDGEKTLQGLEREKETLAGLVHTYRARYEEARIGEEEDKQKAISVSLVEQPRSPEKPAQPKRWFFAVIGAGLGLVASSCIVVYLLVWRETIITAESVERVLNLPVLASVPMRATTDLPYRA